jgi:predicted Zn finger-like uncharacterized protein
VIVTCERCATQFQLDDARVPQRGVRVRCSRCKNSFRVMPGGLASAEQIEDPAGRARGAGEEITQDMPEARSGSGAERSGGGAKAAAARRESEPGSGVEAKAGHGPETEESDWEFNNDTAGDLERGKRAASDLDDSKPEPPEAAPARGRLADDWFGGGAGDAPLELEDRPSPQPVAPAPPALRPRPSPSVTPRAPLPPPVREPAPAPAREAAPALAREPALPPDPDLELASDPETRPAPAPAPAPRERVERRAACDAAEELSSHTWGDLLAAAGDSEVPARRATAPALRSKAMTQLAAWLGRFGHALGSGLTLLLFGAGLYAGLTPPQPIDRPHERIAGFEIDSLEARFVENVATGTLFVVSGRLRNPGPGAAPLGRLALELLDAQGRPLGGAALHAPAPVALMREAPVDALAQLPRLSGEVRPGEVRSFEALVASLPDQAREFRIVESHAAPPL